VHSFCRAIVFSCLVMASHTALARSASNERVRALFVAGTESFNRGEFAKALESFKEAYRVSEQPVFLFNIAQCQRRVGNKQEALLFYKAYLHDLAHAANASEVRNIIAKLEVELAHEESTENGPPRGMLPAAVVSPAGPTREAPTLTATAQSAKATAVSPSSRESDDSVTMATPKPAPPAVSVIAPATPSAASAQWTNSPATRPVAASVSAPQPRPRAQPTYKKWWVWTLVGGAVAASIGVGIGVGLGSPSSNHPSNPSASLVF